MAPSGGGEIEEVTWAREASGVLYVEHRHLTYTIATKGRNGYVSAIDLDTRKLRWRSRALIANARTFVLDGDYIVSGYGFTASPTSCTCSIAATAASSTAWPSRPRRRSSGCAEPCCTCGHTTTSSPRRSGALERDDGSRAV
jgi:hypothetical protein